MQGSTLHHALQAWQQPASKPACRSSSGQGHSKAFAKQSHETRRSGLWYASSCTLAVQLEHRMVGAVPARAGAGLLSRKPAGRLAARAFCCVGQPRHADAPLPVPPCGNVRILLPVNGQRVAYVRPPANTRILPLCLRGARDEVRQRAVRKARLPGLGVRDLRLGRPGQSRAPDCARISRGKLEHLRMNALEQRWCVHPA